MSFYSKYGIEYTKTASIIPHSRGKLAAGDFRV